MKNYLVRIIWSNSHGDGGRVLERIVGNGPNNMGSDGGGGGARENMTYLHATQYQRRHPGWQCKSNYHFREDISWGGQGAKLTGGTQADKVTQSVRTKAIMEKETQWEVPGD